MECFQEVFSPHAEHKVPETYKAFDDLHQLHSPCEGHPLCLQVLHVGDRFTASGNDVAVRDCCSILWVANPEETDFFIKLLLHDLRSLRQNPYIE